MIMLEYSLDHHQISHNLKDSISLWRYMDKSKFALLISQKSSGCLDLLGDDHEGSLPDSIIQTRKTRWSEDKVLQSLEQG